MNKSKLAVYDIGNAGPRNRFTIMTDRGPMIVHNCILGLGYQVGAGKLQNALANGFIRVHLDLAECKRIVNLYRTQYAMISKLWTSCQNAIKNMYDGYDSTIGIGVQLRVSGKDRTIELPNGMKLQYPDIQQGVNDYGMPEFSYQKKRFRAKLYGGALCIAKGTSVVTYRGLVPIEEITSTDMVWDGDNWVTTGGAIAKGTKDCIDAYGVFMTEDHKVLTTEGWKSASQSKGYHRATCRLPDGYELCGVGRKEVFVGDCQTELQQPSQKRNNRRETSVTVVRGDGDCFDDLALQAQAQLAQGTPVRQAEKNIEVYDLMDCGPRNRFVVVGNNGPVIVHNCENVIQALARIVVTYQMLEINKALARMSEERNDGKVRQVVHMVHDEVIVVVPKEEADEVKTLMERIMSTAPSWAPTLPVSCEAGLGVTYAEAK